MVKALALAALVAVASAASRRETCADSCDAAGTACVPSAEIDCGATLALCKAGCAANRIASSCNDACDTAKNSCVSSPAGTGDADCDGEHALCQSFCPDGSYEGNDDGNESSYDGDSLGDYDYSTEYDIDPEYYSLIAGIYGNVDLKQAKEDAAWGYDYADYWAAEIDGANDVERAYLETYKEMKITYKRCMARDVACRDEYTTCQVTGAIDANAAVESGDETSVEYNYDDFDRFEAEQNARMKTQCQCMSSKCQDHHDGCTAQQTLAQYNHIDRKVELYGDYGDTQAYKDQQTKYREASLCSTKKGPNDGIYDLLLIELEITLKMILHCERGNLGGGGNLNLDSAKIRGFTCDKQNTGKDIQVILQLLKAIANGMAATAQVTVLDTLKKEGGFTNFMDGEKGQKVDLDVDMAKIVAEFATSDSGGQLVLAEMAKAGISMAELASATGIPEATLVAAAANPITTTQATPVLLSSEEDGGKTGADRGAIIGGAVGGLIFVVVIMFVVYRWGRDDAIKEVFRTPSRSPTGLSEQLVSQSQGGGRQSPTDRGERPDSRSQQDGRDSRNSRRSAHDGAVLRGVPKVNPSLLVAARGFWQKPAADPLEEEDMNV